MGTHTLVTPALERVQVTAAGRRVVFRRRPAAAGREATPALLLHALAGSWRWWRGVLAHLDPSRQLLLPDLLGYGSSGGLPRNPPDQADALAEALERIGVARLHLAGHSLGGAVAAELAARHPSRVATLTLIDAAGWPAPLFPRYLGRLAQPWSWCRLQFFPTLLSDVLRTGPHRLAAGIRHILSYDVRPALRAIRAPTRVLWGERDRLLPPEQGRAVAGLIAGARFEIVAGAGHIVPADRPAQLARILAEFWGEL